MFSDVLMRLDMCRLFVEIKSIFTYRIVVISFYLYSMISFAYCLR